MSDTQLTAKQFQFLTMVQTVVTNNAINLSLDRDKAIKRRHIFSASGTITLMYQANAAADKLPAELSASDAAHQFLSYFLESLREPGTECPHWCREY